MLQKENTKSLGTFIFKDLLCRWGPITKIITDNRPTFWVAVDNLAECYGIHPIQISPYNSQANGIVKQHHYDVWEAIIKSCNGDNVRNHISVGVERAYLHKLSIDHLHYGVAWHFPA